MMLIDSSKGKTFIAAIGAIVFITGAAFGGFTVSVLGNANPSLEAQLSGSGDERLPRNLTEIQTLDHSDFAGSLGDSFVGFAEAISAGRYSSENPNQLLRRYIENADNDQLRRIAQGALKFPPEFMDNIGDVKTFGIRLAEIVLKDSDVASGQALQEAPNITFADSNEFDYPEDVAGSQFGQDTDKIYAIFSRGTFPGSDVMVKWYHVDTGTYVAIRHHFVDPHAQYNWIFQQGQQGWTPGLYEVELYGGQDDLPIIAAGEYYVN